MKTCLFCGQSENLSVSMTVKNATGAPEEVWICDADEDNATPKKVRERFETKEKLVEELRKQAAALGMQIVDFSTAGKATVPPAPETRPTLAEALPINRAVPVPTSIAPAKGKVLKVKEVITPTKVEGGDAVGTGSVERHKGYDTAKAVKTKDGEEHAPPTVVEHQEQQISGAAGVPVAIPKKIVSNHGTTEISIVDTGGDRALQARLKDMSKSDQAVSFREGYDTMRECTFCGGTGQAKIGNIKCPRCKGAGLSIS